MNYGLGMVFEKMMLIFGYPSKEQQDTHLVYIIQGLDLFISAIALGLQT